MARHDDRDRVAPVRGTDGAARGRAADRARDIAVAAQRAVRDVEERAPHELLERRALRGHLDVERAPLTREVFAQLLGDAREQRRLAGRRVHGCVVAFR